MINILSESQCIKYVEDSTIYKSCKAKEVTKCFSELENELKFLELWPKNTNLVFNLERRNQCYFQHAKCHSAIHSTINSIIMTY